MAEERRETTSLRPEMHVSQARVRRDVRPAGEKLRDFISGADIVTGVFTMAAGMMVFFPQAWFFTLLIIATYSWWLSKTRFRLPFRAPLGWKGKDYSLMKTGSDTEYANAEGIVYLGNDIATRQELWLTNSDARRHIFTLGTTGSGKALPLDALVRTPEGWKRNGDLRPGDRIRRPDGTESTVESIHPQGRMKLYRVEFADGRLVECTGDHLWKVCLTPLGKEPDWTLPAARRPDGETTMRLSISGGEGRIMETSDIGILLGVSDIMSQRYSIQAPLTSPQDGRPDIAVNRANGEAAAMDGIFSVLGGAVDLAGTAVQRREFLGGLLTRPGCAVSAGFLVFPCRDRFEARALRHMVWSLGGVAMAVETLPAGARQEAEWTIHMRLSGLGLLAAHVDGIDRVTDPEGIGILSVEPIEDEAECLCIRTSHEDGLYVTDGYVVTHNTEFLNGLIVQPLSWGSGFLFVDGKGTAPFYARVWSLAKRFGREDDVRCINFMGVSGDSDAPSGGMPTESNTLNPFARGSADQLLNLLASLMGEGEKGGGDMWKNRAVQLVSSAIRVLVEMRNRGEILLDVQTVRDYLPLGKGVNRVQQPQQGGANRRQPMRGHGFDGRNRRDEAQEDGDITPDDLAGITPEEWRDLENRPGMIELYLRSLRGDFSEASRLSLKGFFDSLPGFTLNKATQGQDQDQKTLEQYGYLSMQLTKPLGQMADDFGHIFRTPLGEVDMEDVVYNRRILVVLLPALQKDTAEVRNLGRIIVAMTKSMMGYAAGSSVIGSKMKIIDAQPTTSPSPFIAVFDEVGYYIAEGLDVAAAQARSLGFCIVVGAQDIQAMKKGNPQVADSVIANTFLNAYGATMDASETLQFVQKKTGQQTVAVSQGYSVEEGVMSSRYMDRREVQFQQVDRISLEELQALNEGQFFFMLQGHVIKARTFFVGSDHDKFFSVNKFLKVRGPEDRAPGLDQKEEEEFKTGLLSAVSTLLGTESDALPVAGHYEDRLSDSEAFMRPLPGERAARPCLDEVVGILALLGARFGEQDAGELTGSLDEDFLRAIDVDDMIDEDEDDLYSGGMGAAFDMGDPALRHAASGALAEEHEHAAAKIVLPTWRNDPVASTAPARISEDALSVLAAPAPPGQSAQGPGQGNPGAAAAKNGKADKRAAEDHIIRRTEDDLLPAPPSPDEIRLVQEARRRRKARGEGEPTILEKVNFEAAERMAGIDRMSGVAEDDIQRMTRHVKESGLVGKLDQFRFPQRQPAEMLARVDRLFEIGARAAGDGETAQGNSGRAAGQAREEMADTA